MTSFYIRPCKGNREAWALFANAEPDKWPLETSLSLEAMVRIAYGKYGAARIVIDTK